MSSDEPIDERTVDGAPETALAAPGDADAGAWDDDTLDDELDDEAGDEAPAPPTAMTRVLGIGLAVLLSLGGAVGWAALTTASGRRFALLAVVVGILIGLIVRRVGKLSGVKGGVVAGLLSLFGAALGQFLEGYALQANAYTTAPVVAVQYQNWSLAKQFEEWGFAKGWEVFVKNLGALSWLTLALAAAAAFIYASDSGKRKPAEEDHAEFDDADSELSPDDTLDTGVDGDADLDADSEPGTPTDGTSADRQSEIKD